MVVDARDKFYQRALSTALDTYKKVGHFETKERMPLLSASQQRDLHADVLKRIFTKRK